MMVFTSCGVFSNKDICVVDAVFMQDDSTKMLIQVRELARGVERDATIRFHLQCYHNHKSQTRKEIIGGFLFNRIPQLSSSFSRIGLQLLTKQRTHYR